MTGSLRQSAFFTLKAAQSQARLQHFMAVGSSQSDFPGAVSCSEPRPTACRDNTAQRTPTFWPQSFPTLHSPKGGSSRYPLSKACTLPPALMASGLSTQSPGGFFSSHLKQKWPICIRKGVPPCQEANTKGGRPLPLAQRQRWRRRGCRAGGTPGPRGPQRPSGTAGQRPGEAATWVHAFHGPRRATSGDSPHAHSYLP